LILKIHRFWGNRTICQKTDSLSVSQVADWSTCWNVCRDSANVTCMADSCTFMKQQLCVVLLDMRNSWLTWITWCTLAITI